MQTRMLCPSGLVGLVLLSTPLIASGDEPGAVVISELMWSGSAASSADEWIELYNRGSEPVDLVGWTITRVGDDGETVMVEIEEGLILPDSVFLISNYDHDDARSRLATAPDLVSATVSLPNTKLRLRLYDGQPETADLVDEVDDGTGAPFGGHGGETRASMVRLALDAPGSSEDAWSTADMAVGWDPGATELGTPGSLPASTSGDGDATQVSARLWSQIKMRYR